MNIFHKKIVYVILIVFTVSICLNASHTLKKRNNIEINNSINNYINTDLIRLKAFTPPRTIMVTGTVEALEKETLKFQNLGKIKSIVEEGTSIEGQVYNSKGDVIESGTLVAQQYTEIDKTDLEASKMNLERAKLKLKKTKDDYIRDTTLMKEQAISEKEYELSKISFLRAKSELRDAYQSLEKAEFLFTTDFMYSSFNAVTERIYQSPEVWYESFKDTVTVQMMDPIAIRIPIKYISDINHLSENHLSEKPIIYSPNSNTIIGNWICDYTAFLEDKYAHYFIVPNEKISFYNNLPKKYADIPKISWATKLIRFSKKSDNLAVPVDAVVIDNGKEYVWSLTEKDTVDKENVVNYKTFVSNKVQIQTIDRIRRIGIYKVIELVKNDNLKLYGQIMWDKPPKGLKDNDIVLLDPRKWKLAPGDTVKVLVKLLPMKTGFYVPIDSITLNGKADTYVTLENGEMKKVKVEGSFANLKLISGGGLKEGTFIRQNPNDLQTILKEYYKEISVN